MRPWASVDSFAGLWPRAQQVVLGVIEAMAFSLLIALGAKLRLPWDPVPFTLQTFFVLLAGSALGPRYGALSAAWYIALGAGGIPLFSGESAGWSYLTGVTAGYLFGFVLAAYVVGRLLARVRQPALWPVALVMAAASGIILACGALWLMVGVGMGAAAALKVGVLPFLPGDALKSVLAAAVALPILRRRVLPERRVIGTSP